MRKIFFKEVLNFISFIFSNLSSEFPVVNAATSKTITVTINQLLDIGMHGTCEEFPPGDLLVFVQSGGVTLCAIWNLIRCVFYQLIPAMIIDTGLKMRGMQPR